MTMPRDQVLSKIQKLLALSQSDNEHEAALAAEKASALMEEYQIGISEAEMSVLREEGVVEEYFTVPGLRMKYGWVVYLAMAAANLFDGQVMKTRKLHGTEVVFVGAKSDIESMKAMFMHFYNSWKSFVEADLRDAKTECAGDVWRPKDTMDFKLGHGNGYASRMLARISEIVKEREGRVASTATGKALIIVKSQQVTAHMAKYKSSSWRTKTGTSAGYRAGSSAANQTSMGGSINGRGSAGLLR